jgi:Flp pilus assembly protein TadD
METVYQKIDQFIQNNQLQEALKLLENNLKINQQDANLYLLQGVVYRKLGDFSQAVSIFQKAIFLAPNQADIYSQLGVTFFHQKQLNLALENMDKAVSLEPENPYRYSSRAYIKDANKDIDGAILDYEKAISLDPEDAVAYNNLGMLEEKKGRLEAAKKNFKKSDDLNGIDWDEFKQKLKTFEGEEKEEKLETPKEISVEKPKPSYFSIISSVFTKKEAWKEFISFICNGFKQKSKV